VTAWALPAGLQGKCKSERFFKSFERAREHISTHTEFSYDNRTWTCTAWCSEVALANAVEIKLLCAVAFHPAIDVLIPDFERLSGLKVTVAYGNAGAIGSAA
jgi:hypothetical protein